MRTERTTHKRRHRRQRHCRWRQRDNDSRDRFYSSRCTCNYSEPYCVVTGTHWRCNQSFPRRDLEDQRNKATEIYEFLNTPSPSLPRLNKGSRYYATLVNVLKTYLVKLLYCMGMGSSPIGAKTSPVYGKLLFFQG